MIVVVDPSSTVERLVGVYDADGTVLGELSYFLRARVGRAHCALCDVTHGRVRERDDWRAARDRLPVPFATHHRDDQPEAVRAAAGGLVPIVAAELADGEVVVLLDPDDLERCDGSPDRLIELVEQAVESGPMQWPAPPPSTGAE